MDRLPEVIAITYTLCSLLPILNTIADAAFIVGETIPIRLFLGGFDLTPTFREVNKKYSTRYYLSLVLIDEGLFSFGASFFFPRFYNLSERLLGVGVHKPLNSRLGSSELVMGKLWLDKTTNKWHTDARRYFKQSEIVLFRQAP